MNKKVGSTWFISY